MLKGAQLRRTAAQLRETLFAVMGLQIEGSRLLDAYAGSGAVDLEASSRGAARVVFTEPYRPAAEIIRKNLVTFGVSGDQPRGNRRERARTGQGLRRRFAFG